MKKIKISSFIIFIIIFAITISGCANNKNAETDNAITENNTASEQSLEGDNETIDTEIKIGNKSFDAVLLRNETTEELMKRMPLKINMQDMNANEKFYYFDDTLPADAKRIGEIKSGDIMLYGSDCLVVFYEDFNSAYSYTRLGRIENAKGLKEVMGNGNVEMSFSLANN